MLRLALHRLPCVAVLGLAGWTLLAQLAVALGLGLVALEVAAAIAMVATVFVARRAVGSQCTIRPRADAVPSPEPTAPGRVALALVGAIAVVVAYRLTGSLWVLSIGGAALLITGSIARSREAEPGSDPRPLSPSRAASWGLLALATATAALALVAHAPDPDDAFYLNVAAQAAGSPWAPLLVEDGIFGLEGMPIQLPVYRAHSIELLVAAAAHLTGLEPIVVAHLGLVACAGFLLPLAVARLLHRIVPGHAEVGALIAVLALVACGEGEQGPGHFALLRLHQGKGILLAVALPLLLDAALAYAARPSRRRWVLLFAVQVAAVGLTSSALFVVPLTALLTLVAAWRGGHLRALAAGLLASGHAAVVLAWLGPPMAQTVRALAQVQSATDALTGHADLAARTLERSVGDSSWSAILLVLALCAWAVPRSAAAGRALGAGLCAVLLVFLCPPVAPALAERLLAPEVYFRTLWIVPWGPLAAVSLLALAQHLPAGLRGRRTAVAASVAFAIALPLVASPFTVLSSRAGTRVDLPGPKVPPLEYEAARWLSSRTPTGAYVLAPDDVAPWVSTFRSLTHPIYSRYIYERFLLLGLDAEEVHQRRTLTGFVSRKGLHLDRTDVLCHHAGARQLQGIALRRFGAATEAQGLELASCGFVRVGRNERYDVWVRDAAR